MIVFRHADPRFPFLWETASQPSGRWHAAGQGPAHYLADTPFGAWAELLRHEEITDTADLAGVRRAIFRYPFFILFLFLGQFNFQLVQLLKSVICHVFIDLILFLPLFLFQKILFC